MGGKTRFINRVPAIHSKNLYYRSNGGGRDSYIVATSGGFNNPNKLVEFKEAFVNSLRQYERPRSSYTKQGGMEGGMKRTASASTFNLKKKDSTSNLKSKNYLIDTQLTFSPKHHESQKNLRIYQKDQTIRLARPKSVRKKLFATIEM